MKTMVLGLGPVGLATSWDLLCRNISIHGEDTDRKKIEDFRAQNFHEIFCANELFSQYQNSKFTFSTTKEKSDYFETIIICTGTPINESTGAFEINSVVNAIRYAIGNHTEHQHIILRSTLSPGTIKKEIIPLLDSRISLSYFPEFLREKFMRDDILQPPLKIAAHSSPKAQELFMSLFPDTEHFANHFSELETVKIASNAFHALKISFANEISNICESVGASPNLVMDLFCSDKKLNISEKYLKPGAPFSGRCLEKDLTALETQIENSKLKCPLIPAIRQSNNLRNQKCT